MQDTAANVKTPQDVTILQIVPRLQSGGAEQSTCEIAAGIVQAGARSLVASAGGRLEERLKREGSTVLIMPAATKNPLRMMDNIVTLCIHIRSKSVSLIHARSRAPAWSAFFAARLCRIPFVTTYHGAHAPAGPLKRAYNGVMARGDVTITNSNYMASRIRADYPIDPDCLNVIYRGVDLARFDPKSISPERIATLRDAWDVPSGARIVLVPARISPRKGQDVVIRALAALGERAGNAVCVMVGDAQGSGGFADRLRQKATDLGVAGRLRLPGHCADMPAAYAASAITLIPSIEPEAFGRTAPEAQAMGSLVIATDIGGAVETVLVPPDVDEAQRTGWRVPPGDAQALADTLSLVLSLDESAKRSINQAARQRVEATFSLQHMVKATLDVYDRLLGSTLGAHFERTTG